MPLMQQYLGIIIVALPGIIAGLFAAGMAWKRGRNVTGWGLLCLVLPVCLLVIWSKPPIKEVPGGFRRCPQCNEWLKWQEATCRYCKAELPPIS